MVELGPQAPTAPAPAESPPQGLPEGSAPESTADLIKAAGPATEAKPPEGDDSGGRDGAPEGAPPEGEEPKGPAWSEAKDLDSLVAVEEVAQHIEGRETAAFDRGRSETHSRMQPFLQKQEETLGSIDKTMGQFAKSWNRMVKDGALTKDDIGDLLENNEGAFAALAGVHQDAGMWQGIGQVVERVGSVLNDNGLAHEFVGRVQNLRKGLQDPTFVEDFVEKVAEAKTKPIRDQLKEANANILRLENEAKQAGRTETPPPAKTSGRSSGKAPDTSDAARAQRLAYGRDDAGNAPTDEDRAWIAARN